MPLPTLAMDDMPNFIDDDEYIILFDGSDRPIQREGFALVGSSGVRTALRNLDWIFVEKTQGVYDWSEYDEFVDNCVHGGLKALLITPNCVAACMPDDWYCWSENGTPQRFSPHYSVFSPWHAEAQAYQSAFVQMVIDRYASYPVRVIRGGAHGGESLLPYTPCYFDPTALESFRVWANAKFYGNLGTFCREEGASFQSWEQVRPGVFDFYHIDHLPITKLWLKESLTDMVVRQQAQLIRHYGGEAWLMLAHCWKDVMETGNFIIPDIVQSIMDRVGPTHVNWIAFAHFNMGSTLQHIALQRVKDKNVQLWTGSQYCEGLPVNTGLAIKSGIRGFVTGPLSLEDFHDQRQIESWMVENFRNSLAEWRARDGLS